MNKAVAYYRSFPSQPEASDFALNRQREAVRKEVEDYGLDLVAEFVECEGEPGSDTYPAFRAAVSTASAHSSDENLLAITLIIASQAAIGTGDVFREPEVDRTGVFMWSYLQVRSIPTAEEIELPAGAPGSMCLYADCRPGQRDTLIYLCNPGPETLTDVAVTTHTISMHDFYHSRSGERPWEESGRGVKQAWVAIPPRRCVFIDTADHRMWDFVSRYRIAYTDAPGRRWEVEANDHNLSIFDLAEDPQNVWKVVGPAREVADLPATIQDQNIDGHAGDDRT